VPTSATTAFRRSGVTLHLLHHPTTSWGLRTSTWARSHDVGFLIVVSMFNPLNGPPFRAELYLMIAGKQSQGRGTKFPARLRVWTGAPGRPACLFETGYLAEGIAMEALRLMQDGGFRHVPITRNKRGISVVSVPDFSGPEHTRLEDERETFERLR
jgi:hypothetical protein